MAFEGLSNRLKEGIKKLLNSTGNEKIEEVLTDIQTALIEGDVDKNTVETLMKKIREDIKSNKGKGLVTREKVIDVIYNDLVEIVGNNETKINIDSVPFKILLVGLFGSGKTTTAAKLANYYKKRGYRVLLLGLDTFRPAAYQQLEQLSKQINVKIMGGGDDPIKAIKGAMGSFKNFDVVIADSAGRDILDNELVKEIKEEKVRTGTRRLDDLTFGGFPVGSNIIVMGPPYSGKEVLVYSFLSEGVKKGIPVVVILVDKTVDIFEEEMNYVLPTWKSYVEKGLVKYIDAYSRTIGEKASLPGVIYLESQTDFNGITESIDKIISEIKDMARYYRLAFFTLSTILTFGDAQSVLKFLQPFTTKRKKENAVSMYLLEKGLQEENTVQMVSYLMDGTIEFKIETGKVYLQIKGITDVQSRSWIEITPSKSGIIMGSFTLGHIR